MKGGKAYLVVLCALLAAQISGASGVLFDALTDARFRWFPREATGNVVLVAIDPQSINEIGVWPWPRTHHADLIRKLDAAGATDIVLDIDFSSRQSEAADRAFLDALEQSKGSVVLPSFVQEVRDAAGVVTTEVTRPLPEFGNASWPASANVMTEGDGRVRRYSRGIILDGQFHPSMGALLAGVYDPRGGDFFIDYAINADTIPVLSYADVLDGTGGIEKVRGKKVIVGATAIELGDRFSAPNSLIIPGAKLQALAAESLIQGRALARTSAAVSVLGLLGLAGLSLLIRRGATGVRISVIASMALGVELLAAVLQSTWGVLLDASLWHVAIATYVGAICLEEIDVRGLMAKIAENRFRRIAMSLSEGLVCTDSEGIITFWSPSATRIFGYESEEMLGLRFTRLLVKTGALDSSDCVAILFGNPEQASGRTLELEGCRKSGETFPLETGVSCWKHTDTFHYGLVLRDISARKREEERIRFLAEHDVLTGLANRSKINDQLEHILEQARAARHQVAVIIFGLDSFKDINDTLGQDRGDKIICAVADKLRNRLGRADLVARVSGDEFAVVLPMAETRAGSASALVESVAAEFARVSINLNDRMLTVRSSLGSAVFPGDAETAGDLMANAALAMQDAKLHRRGSLVSYRPEIRTKIDASRRLEMELVRAFECNEFELFYQPQINLETGSVIGAEALIRWHHPQRGLVPPGEFIPVLETMPLSVDVSRWVITTACKQAGAWHRAGAKIRVGINLSPSLFESPPRLVETIIAALETADVPTSLIELELTESIVLEDDDKTIAALRQLHQAGVAIAFDDFGTGHASLTHLKKFPLDRLKIDQTFVRDLVRSQDDGAIVSALVGLGKLLSLDVTAEGIEDRETADALIQMGCGEGQGYYFGRPVPAAEFSRNHLPPWDSKSRPEIASIDVTSAA